MKNKIGLSDEIFQAGNPVLVGVDPLNIFVYLMVPSKNRDSIAWWMAYTEKKGVSPLVRLLRIELNRYRRWQLLFKPKL